MRAFRIARGEDVPDRATGLDSDVAAARQRFHDDSSTRLASAAENAELDAEEAEVFALLFATEVDLGLEKLLMYLYGNNRLTLGSFANLFPGSHPGPLATGNRSGLRRAAFVAIDDAGPWAERVVALHPSVIWTLLGDESPDPDLPPRCFSATDPSGEVDPTDGRRMVVVSGPDRVRRLQVAVAMTSGERFLVTPAPTTQDAWDAVVREATLSGSGLVIEVDGDRGLSDAGARVIEHADHLAVALVATRDIAVEDLPRRPWQSLYAPDIAPTDAEWETTLGPDIPRSHPLTSEQLALVGQTFEAVGRDLGSAIRRVAGTHIERLTVRVRPTRGWDDLVLPPATLDHLQELASRYRHRALVFGPWGFRSYPSPGLVAMFSGPSGTGKTMAAEVLAGDLGLELFKLELSSVVSKYIGETEKNLDALFDAAGSANVVLFFDEADALFGKRTQVSDSHDRYANIEVSYLLQRLESYEGVVIMASNIQSNVDPAFVRRLHSVIEFRKPEADARQRLWELNLPPGAPTKELDLHFIAGHFDLVGGAIRNAAITAAFAAANRDEPITMRSLVIGVARELEKQGRLVDRHDFGSYAELLPAAPD